MLEVHYHHAKFSGARISPAAGTAKNVEFFVCLSACSSRFWTSEFVRPISPWSRRNTETILMTLDRGRFVLVHPCSTFSDCRQLSRSLNAEIQRRQKWDISPPEGDTINRSRRILARNRILWVCYSTPNLALIESSVKRGRYRSKGQNLPQIVVFGHRKPTQWTHVHENCTVSVDLGSALTHQIWPSSVKGGRYRSPPNVKNCPKLWFSATGSRHNEHIHMKFGV